MNWRGNVFVHFVVTSLVITALLTIGQWVYQEIQIRREIEARVACTTALLDNQMRQNSLVMGTMSANAQLVIRMRDILVLPPEQHTSAQREELRRHFKTYLIYLRNLKETTDDIDRMSCAPR